MWLGPGLPQEATQGGHRAQRLLGTQRGGCSCPPPPERSGGSQLPDQVKDRSFKKFKYFDSLIPFLGIYSKELIRNVKTILHFKIFRKTLFTIE